MNELERAPPKRRGAKDNLTKTEKRIKKSEKESKKNYIGSFSSGHVMRNHSG